MLELHRLCWGQCIPGAKPDSGEVAYASNVVMYHSHKSFAAGYVHSQARAKHRHKINFNMVISKKLILMYLYNVPQINMVY